VNPLARLPAVPLVLVTATVTAPALPEAGVVAVIVVLFTTVTFVAAVLPKVTVAPLAKFVPVIVTDVPPAIEPLLGDTFVTAGVVELPYHSGICTMRDDEFTCWPTRPFTDATVPPGVDSLIAAPAPYELTPVLKVIVGVTPLVDSAYSAYCAPPWVSSEFKIPVKPAPGVTVSVAEEISQIAKIRSVFPEETVSAPELG
jgi:hypothetical protein